MGGRNLSCDLGWGGGKRTIEGALKNQFWRPQKVGFGWSVPVSSKENDRGVNEWGGERVISGGSKAVFGEGFYDMFSPPPEFSNPPLFLSEIQR